MIKNQIQKGFTLIELLVVIAIIGILAGILFIAIDPSAQTNKAEDAKKQSQLASVRTQAALIFSENSSFSAVCGTTSPSVTQNANIAALLTGNGGGCNSTPSAWAATVKLADNTYECADSTGITKNKGTTVLGTATDC